MKFILLLSITFLISCNTSAQRTGRNGGGLAEMKFIFLFQNINIYLKACFTENNLCQLSNQQRSLIEKILIADLKETVSTVISFDEKINGNDLFKTQPTVGAPVTLSSPALYIDDLPIKATEMLKLAIAIRWFHLGTELNQIILISESQKISIPLSENTQTTRLSTTIPELKIHQYQFELNLKNQNIIMLEDQKKSIPLNEIISKKLNCTASEKIVLENIRIKEAWPKYSLWADLKSNCNENKKNFSNLVLISFEINNYQLIEESSIILQIKAQ